MLIHSKIYKQFYPMRSTGQLAEMEVRDKNQLIKWVKAFLCEINAINFENRKKATSHGLKECFQIRYRFSETDAKNLAEKLRKGSCNITEYEMAYINSVIYRHKYNRVLYQLINLMCNGTYLPVDTAYWKEKETSIS